KGCVPIIVEISQPEPEPPFAAIIALLVLRVLAEYFVAHFRMDKSLHDQVTGRAAPPPKAE
ncbi:MAG: hypothetical protein AAGL97_16565, partial [Pseudomonadota bacterium]